MSVTHPSLFLLLKRYPERRQQVRNLFRTNESFKAICEDYRQCHDVLTYWLCSSRQDAPLRRAEYQQLRTDLEDEIEQILQKTG